MLMTAVTRQSLKAQLKTDISFLKQITSASMFLLTKAAELNRLMCIHTLLQSQKKQPAPKTEQQHTSAPVVTAIMKPLKQPAMISTAQNVKTAIMTKQILVVATATREDLWALSGRLSISSINFSKANSTALAVQSIGKVQLNKE